MRTLFLTAILVAVPAVAHASDAGTGPICSADGNEVIASSGTITDCSPYRCDPTVPVCRSLCVRDEDCISTYRCDEAARKCVRAPADAGTDGGDAGADNGTTKGCTCGVAAKSSGGGAVCAFAFVVVFARRRRRS